MSIRFSCYCGPRESYTAGFASAVDVVDRILKRFHSIHAEKSVDTQCPAPRFLSTVNTLSQDIAHLFSATHMPSNSCLLSMLMSIVRDDDF